MNQLACPRCQEPFEASDLFCKQCGLRKGKAFSKQRWWRVALLVNLLLLLLLVALREKLMTSRGYSLDISNGELWLMLGVVFIFLLVSTFFVYHFSLIVGLRRHGLTVSGKVIEHREHRTRKGRRWVASIVEFIPETAGSPVCVVEDRGWQSPQPLHKKVKVLYDPYNPTDCTWVGSGGSDLVITALFGLLFSSLPVVFMIALLTVPPTSP
jgi:hypothetical protein